ncbi:MAG: hypothetical protein KKF85_14145 [Gammaproteobacteria bacterium]|nr:hypothetical protein [Rhodocyclaceae bacterium]MBU3909584.1 hypothetical protein [Gammaproteobacteria bacterium]MBU4003247.1 hypothetical protein [Gammaproteobacteria bacterium]MBU4022296.1 hypothetical protein [Gammaproteobacteria bacterium]MBU4097603.1 hypothetical protein [Gammaproteobacteria bacterium]
MLEKVLTVLVGTVVLVAAFMFSLVILAVAVVVGLMIWGYFWWKTREIRQVMREQREQQQSQPRQQPSPDGHVIEGEAIVVDEVHEQTQDTKPQHRSNPPEK